MAAATTGAAASGLATRLHSLCSPSSLVGDGVVVVSSRRCCPLSCALPNLGCSSASGPSETPTFGNLFPAISAIAGSSQSTSPPSPSSSLLFCSATKRAARMVSLRVRADIGEEVEQVAVYGDEEDDGAAPTVGPKLYVGNLPWKVDSESLAEVFETVGKVELVEVVYDRMSGRSRGFGFVTMGSADEAQRAVDQLNGMDLEGRTLRVNFPQVGLNEGRVVGGGGGGGGGAGGYGRRAPRQENPNKLYVGNLSWGMDDYGLHDLFSSFGKVVEAKVVTDRDTGRSRGFGFVTFENDKEVEQAIQGLNGVDVDGRSIRVNLASSKPTRGGGFRGGRGGYGGQSDDGYGGDGY